MNKPAGTLWIKAQRRQYQRTEKERSQNDRSGILIVSVSSRPSSISARVSYHGHFREHGHYRGQKHALHQSTLDHHRTQPAV
ncbi:hypothetical protein EPK90_22615 (plasmid) [Pantoea ananatis]|nr:hypothetical protein EPK90_22615 [Pantoea ananatis]